MRPTLGRGFPLRLFPAASEREKVTTPGTQTGRRGRDEMPKMLETRREAVLLNAANDNQPPAGRGAVTANLAPYTMGVAIWMVLAWSVGLL